jgi:hypothetical protein
MGTEASRSPRRNVTNDRHSHGDHRAFVAVGGGHVLLAGSRSARREAIVGATLVSMAMTKRNQKLLVITVSTIMVALVVVPFALSLRGSSGKPDKPQAGECVTERGILGSTSCRPTKEQVAAASGVPVPPLAQDFRATYEQFQDWRLESTFRVPLESAPQYTSLPRYPGLKVGAGPKFYRDEKTGQNHELALVEINGALEVRITVFTT